MKIAPLLCIPTRRMLNGAANPITTPTYPPTAILLASTHHIFSLSIHNDHVEVV